MPNLSLLYGADPEPRLVAAQPGADGATMVLYQRQADGTTTRRTVPFHPFFFLSDPALIPPALRPRWLRQLDGPHPLNHLAVFTSLDEMRAAARAVAERSGGTVRESDALYLRPDPVHQFLTATGRTLFKGMTFPDLRRLQLDIEVITDGSFPSAERAGDRIVLISMSDSTGWEHLIDGRTLDEPAMLERFVDLVRERDPDVLEGHNLFNFDLPYLTARAARHGVRLGLGRDGSEPTTFETSIRFAERSMPYTACEIAGRHVIDTYFQVLAYDVFKRDLPSYGLKAAARYFGFARPDRVYLDGADLTRLWREQPEQVAAYALDDVRETRSLAAHLSGATFYLTQLLPFGYGTVARLGQATRIEALLVREYLRRRHSLPRPGSGGQAVGGYTDVFLTGVVGPIVYADVESLYPSLMLLHGIAPATDTLGLFSRTLGELTALRFAAKDAMQAATEPQERSRLDALQSTYKLLINAHYGYLGFRGGAFNDMEQADRVTTLGQETLRSMMTAVQARGGTVVEVDTDGIFFIPPPHVSGDEAERAFVARLSDALPAGIKVGFDGRFARMLSYKKKNYALLGYDGKLKFKGSSLVSRSTEAVGRAFVRSAVRLLLDGDIAGLHELYLNTRRDIEAHRVPIADLARTETLNDTLDAYARDLASGKRPRSAAYELALQAIAEGRSVRKGDRISYYVVGSGADVRAFESCAPVERYDPAQPDENVAYYLKRLDEVTRKFAPFFTEADFQHLFSEEDLFGFDPTGIVPLVRTPSPDEPD